MENLTSSTAMVSERADVPFPSGSRLSTDYFEPRWYATYTCANHEKRVSKQLDERSIEHFLPLYDAVHRWKDRHMRLQLPLFPGYVFVHLALRDRLKILQIPGVVRLVAFSGHPSALPEGEIEALRIALARQLRLEPHPYLIVGRRARIKNGPFQSREGILVRKKGIFRVVLSLDVIMRSAAVEVDSADIEMLGAA